MTPDRAATNPRTAAPPLNDIQVDLLRRMAAPDDAIGTVWVRRLLATLDEVRAAQEAPAPEGLRTMLREAAQRALEVKPTGNEPQTWANGIGVGIAAMQREVERALSAPPTPAEPPRCSECGVPIAEHPDTDDCAVRAEARPPEGLDAAWAAAEAALPEGWDLMVGHTSECRFCEGWWATASKRLTEPPHYPKVISSETDRPRGQHHDATPAAALLALAARLSAGGAE